jgi:8-hydroxy-5-deazaflavin:NADPH oxidoreductase
MELSFHFGASSPSLAQVSVSQVGVRRGEPSSLDLESSGQILAGLLPAGTRLVKAFGTLSAPSLAAAARQEPERAVLFYAANDDSAGDPAAALMRTAGFDPVRIGGLDQSIRIEMFGDLHEYGALGRVVTRSEALKAI